MKGRPTPGSCVYLLFAGSHRTNGGLGDLAGIFDAEADARAAFTGLRLGTETHVDWAELAAVDAGGQVRVLCWFGHLRPAPLSGSRPASANHGQRAMRFHWYRSRRVPGTRPAEGLGAR